MKKIISLFLIFIFFSHSSDKLNASVGVEKWVKSLIKAGCYDNIDQMLENSTYTQAEKSFIKKITQNAINPKNSYSNESALKQEDVENTQSSRIRRSNKRGKIRRYNREFKNCKASVGAKRVEKTPKDFVQFAPATIDLNCTKGTKLKVDDPTCRKWFEETIDYIKEKSDKNSLGPLDNFPFDLSFEGHTNHISNRTIYDMINSPRNCKEPSGIFKLLNLCQMNNLYSINKSCYDLRSEQCQKNLSAFKKKYLRLLSGARAKSLLNKFKEISQSEEGRKILLKKGLNLTTNKSEKRKVTQLAIELIRKKVKFDKAKKFIKAQLHENEPQLQEVETLVNNFIEKSLKEKKPNIKKILNQCKQKTKVAFPICLDNFILQKNLNSTVGIDKLKKKIKKISPFLKEKQILRFINWNYYFRYLKSSLKQRTIYLEDKVEEKSDSENKILTNSDDIDTRNQRAQIKLTRKPWRANFGKREKSSSNAFLNSINKSLETNKNLEIRCAFSKETNDLKDSLTDFERAGLTSLTQNFTHEGAVFNQAWDYFQSPKSEKGEKIWSSLSNQKRVIICNTSKKPSSFKNSIDHLPQILAYDALRKMGKLQQEKCSFINDHGTNNQKSQKIENYEDIIEKFISMDIDGEKTECKLLKKDQPNNLKDFNIYNPRTWNPRNLDLEKFNQSCKCNGQTCSLREVLMKRVFPFYKTAKGQKFLITIHEMVLGLKNYDSVDPRLDEIQNFSRQLTNCIETGTNRERLKNALRSPNLDRRIGKQKFWIQLEFLNQATSSGVGE